jgi:ubiquinone biosynthesis protein
VMVEGVATGLDPDVNMWEIAEPVVRDWLRGELGPEALLADRIVEDVRTLSRLPDLVRRIEARYPAEGGAPPAPPMTVIEPVRLYFGWLGYVAVALAAGAAGAGVMAWLR